MPGAGSKDLGQTSLYEGHIETMLGGSWLLISGVVKWLTMVLSHEYTSGTYTYNFITSPEPPSNGVI